MTITVELEKVTVSQKAAETIREGLKNHSAEELVKMRATINDVAIGSFEDKLCGISLDTLVRAVYIGYKSPTDKLADYIQNMVPENTSDYDAFNISYLKGKADGAREAAEILGVNLPEK